MQRKEKDSISGKQIRNKLEPQRSIDSQHKETPKKQETYKQETNNTRIQQKYRKDSKTSSKTLISLPEPPPAPVMKPRMPSVDFDLSIDLPPAPPVPIKNEEVRSVETVSSSSISTVVVGKLA